MSPRGASFFADVKVPKHNVLGEPGEGFRSLTHFLAEERLITAAGAIAVCQVAFDITREIIGRSLDLDERKLGGKEVAAGSSC